MNTTPNPQSTAEEFVNFLSKTNSPFQGANITIENLTIHMSVEPTSNKEVDIKASDLSTDLSTKDKEPFDNRRDQILMPTFVPVSESAKLYKYALMYMGLGVTHLPVEHIQNASDNPENTGITDDQVIETFRTMFENPIARSTIRRDFKHALWSDHTTKTISKGDLQGCDVGVRFIVADRDHKGKIYIHFTKVEGNSWTSGVYRDNTFLEEPINTAENQTAQIVHFNTSTAGLLSFLSEIKNPEKWELAYTSSHSLRIQSNTVETLLLKPTVIAAPVHAISKGSWMWVVPVGSLSLTPEERGQIPNKLGSYSITHKQVDVEQSYCRCLKIDDNTWTVHKTVKHCGKKQDRQDSRLQPVGSS